MTEREPSWPPEAIWPPGGLTAAESAIEPRAWFLPARDGYPLAVLSWPSALAAPRGRIVILHGVQSLAGWYHGLGRRLAAAGYESHFPDRRGSGANTQARGHAPSARCLVDDVVNALESI